MVNTSGYAVWCILVLILQGIPDKKNREAEIKKESQISLIATKPIRNKLTKSIEKNNTEKEENYTFPKKEKDKKEYWHSDRTGSLPFQELRAVEYGRQWLFYPTLV